MTQRDLEILNEYRFAGQFSTVLNLVKNRPIDELLVEFYDTESGAYLLRTTPEKEEIRNGTLVVKIDTAYILDYHQCDLKFRYSVFGNTYAGYRKIAEPSIGWYAAEWNIFLNYLNFKETPLFNSGGIYQDEEDHEIKLVLTPKNSGFAMIHYKETALEEVLHQ